MRTRTLVAALAVGALVVPLTSAMSAPTAAPKGKPCTPRWELVPTPPPAAGYVDPPTVSAISREDVRISGVTSGVSPWSMRWNGRSVVEAPAPPQGLLRPLTGMRTSSSYSSADEGWLLLDFPGSYTGNITTAAHWRDGRWTLTPTAVPDDPVPDGDLALMSVVSLAPDDAWAVGSRSDAEGWSRGLIEHWDGTQWTVVDDPELDQRGVNLFDVAAASPTDVWAVGTSSPDTGSWTDWRSFVMHYDGSEWTTVPTPETPAELRPAKLDSVSVTEDGQVWAVGLTGAETGAFGSSLIMRYDGSRWHELPDPGLGETRIAGVYASAEDDAWVVADPRDGSPTVLLHWDGTSWQTAEWPGPKLLGLRYVAADIDGTGPHDVWVTGIVQQLEGSGPVVPVTAAPQIAHLSCKRK